MLVKIETYFDGERWCARGIGEDIFTQGKTLEIVAKLHFDYFVNEKWLPKTVPFWFA
jgi:hypothetical protein